MCSVGVEYAKDEISVRDSCKTCVTEHPFLTVKIMLPSDIYRPLKQGTPLIGSISPPLASFHVFVVK